MCWISSLLCASEDPLKVSRHVTPTPLFSEMSLVLGHKREVRVYEDPKEMTLVLELSHTTSDEIQSLYHYDEAMVHRLIIEERDTYTKVLFFLKDGVKSSVQKLEQPFRVIIALFKDYETLEINPSNGLPFTHGITWKQTSYLPHTEGSVRQDKPLTNPMTLKNRSFIKPLTTTSTQSVHIKTHEDTVSHIENMWKDKPVYVYKIISEPYAEIHESSEKSFVKDEHLKDGIVIAQNALRNFTLGQTTTALELYKNLLKNYPQIFDMNSIYLWSLAEMLFFRKNFTIAKAYYEELIQKFPESTLSLWSALRRIDIEAMKSISENNSVALTDLCQRIDHNPSEDKDLEAQKFIRCVFWKGDISLNHSEVDLPLMNKEEFALSESFLGNMSNAKTFYLIESLRLKYLLQDAIPWATPTGVAAGDYFNTFKNLPTPNYSKNLESEIIKKISLFIVQKSNTNDFLSAIHHYEALPEHLTGIKNSASVSWAMAEAYRHLHQPEKSFYFYKLAKNKFSEPVMMFKINFWISMIGLDRLDTNVDINKDLDLHHFFVKSLTDEIKASDKDAIKYWMLTSKEEQENIQTIYKKYFENSLVDNKNGIYLKTSPILILDDYTKKLATKNLDTMSSDATQKDSEDGSSVILIEKLIQRFKKLGLHKERRSAVHLLETITPSNLNKNKESQVIWVNEIMSLAEEYRLENEYYKSGKLYTLMADKLENFPKRSESYYKGGLLLYQSGKRSEALEALTKASQDNDNIFYANLAKERLIQMNQN